MHFSLSIHLLCMWTNEQVNSKHIGTKENHRCDKKKLSENKRAS